MSACLSGGGLGSRTHRGCRSSVLGMGRFGNRAASVSFSPKRVDRPRNQAILAMAAEVGSQTGAVATEVGPPMVAVKSGRRGRGTEKLDKWMRESVVEIVKSLGTGEAKPLLVRLYGGDCATRIRTETAVEEDWKRIKGRWRSGVEPSPEGIILVEELKDEVVIEEDSSGNWEERQGQKGENTKAWGVLLMGKGEEGGVASYLLKTTSSGSQPYSGGYSCNCTYFSLVKVKSFWETTRSQLSNCWLVQAP